MVICAKAQFGEPMGFDEFQQVRYGMAIWLLQENAGLTFKEARVFMAGTRQESAEDLSKALNVTKQAVYNLASSAKAKMGEIEDLDSVFKGYFPMIVDYGIKRKGSKPLF
ncbi:MAG: hypothetical protein FWC29_00720 [Methanomassiliicoccaceae archaeon]|nr:hypothetical protein [Methanomassiliicoccaceae archaeon]